MSIFTIAVNEAEVADLRFADGLTPEGFAPRNGIEHLDLAVELVQRKAEVASIIVVVSPLEQELWDNPRFATWTAQIGSCEARVEARRRLMTQKFGPVEVTARARELGFPLAGSSAAEADVNNVDVGDTRSPSYYTQVFDAIVDEFETAEMIQVLDEARNDCRFVWPDDDDADNFTAESYKPGTDNNGDNESDDPRELENDEAEGRWAIRRREMLAPFPLIDRRRRYDLPEPLHHWDRRNTVQQWYFTRTETSDNSGDTDPAQTSGRTRHTDPAQQEITWRQGGSGSSGQRETHGLWAHTCAALTKIHGIAVPTTVLLYDSRNTLRVVRASQSLLVDRVDLYGNYRIAYEASEALIGTHAFDAHRAFRQQSK